ncbi:hypothetical protein JB92DRAFT_1680328 [Gautieria morchelliformis]|nr:hypothetical protein JB92DRAFT_1680328 [Gautieria morchelliformis]
MGFTPTVTARHQQSLSSQSAGGSPPPLRASLPRSPASRTASCCPAQVWCSPTDQATKSSPGTLAPESSESGSGSPSRASSGPGTGSYAPGTPAAAPAPTPSPASHASPALPIRRPSINAIHPFNSATLSSGAPGSPTFYSPHSLLFPSFPSNRSTRSPRAPLSGSAAEPPRAAHLWVSLRPGGGGVIVACIPPCRPSRRTGPACPPQHRPPCPCLPIRPAPPRPRGSGTRAALGTGILRLRLAWAGATGVRGVWGGGVRLGSGVGDAPAASRCSVKGRRGSMAGWGKARWWETFFGRVFLFFCSFRAMNAGVHCVVNRLPYFIFRSITHCIPAAFPRARRRYFYFLSPACLSQHTPSLSSSLSGATSPFACIFPQPLIA